MAEENVKQQMYFFIIYIIENAAARSLIMSGGARHADYLFVNTIQNNKVVGQ